MNLPTKITVVRLAMIPLIIAAFCLEETIWWMFIVSAGLFFVASITDFLDGYIARKYNLVTTFGKFADPLADKMLVLTSFLILMVQGLRVPGWPDELYVTPLWGVAIILLRELMVSGIRLVAAQKGEVMAAGWAGKVKTFVTMVALCFAFLATLHMAVAILALILVYVSVVLTVYSGIVYFINAKDILLESV